MLFLAASSSAQSLNDADAGLIARNVQIELPLADGFPWTAGSPRTRQPP